MRTPEPRPARAPSVRDIFSEEKVEAATRFRGHDRARGCLGMLTPILAGENYFATSTTQDAVAVMTRTLPGGNSDTVRALVAALEHRRYRVATLRDIDDGAWVGAYIPRRWQDLWLHEGALWFVVSFPTADGTGTRVEGKAICEGCSSEREGWDRGHDLLVEILGGIDWRLRSGHGRTAGG
jgi:hypothetical protein